VANYQYYLHAHKRAQGDTMKASKNPIVLSSIAERIRLWRCGTKCRFTEEELYSFEGLVAATDMFGVITNATEWREIEKSHGFNKIIATIKEIRAELGYPDNKQLREHEARQHKAEAREAQKQA
jgi:hypothetical protein